MPYPPPLIVPELVKLVIVPPMFRIPDESFPVVVNVPELFKEVIVPTFAIASLYNENV